MIRYLLILLLIGFSVPTALGRTKKTKGKKRETTIRVPGIPEPKPKQISKRVKWWKKWLGKDKLPITEISAYIAYLEKLDKDAQERYNQELERKSPRFKWVNYYKRISEFCPKMTELLGVTVKAKIRYERVEKSVRPDYVKKREMLVKQLAQLHEDYQKVSKSYPRKPR